MLYTQFHKKRVAYLVMKSRVSFCTVSAVAPELHISLQRQLYICILEVGHLTTS